MQRLLTSARQFLPAAQRAGGLSELQRAGEAHCRLPPPPPLPLPPPADTPLAWHPSQAAWRRPGTSPHTTTAMMTSSPRSRRRRRPAWRAS